MAKTARLAASERRYAETRELVAMRDGNSCVRCDRSFDVTHHRAPRGMGGSSRDVTAHDPAVLVALCDPCHAWVESEREAATALGYLIPAGVDPETHPVRWHGQWVLLTSRGTTLRTERPRHDDQ